MGRIIAIANQKGGVGKTTTAINLSACLAEKGMKVLVIDIDPQGNTTSGLGINKDDLENTIYQMLIDECAIEKCMCRSIVENLFVLPSDVPPQTGQTSSSSARRSAARVLPSSIADSSCAPVSWSQGVVTIGAEAFFSRRSATAASSLSPVSFWVRLRMSAPAYWT